MTHPTGPSALILPCPFPDCRRPNPFEDDDRGTEIYCRHCGRAIAVPPPDPGPDRDPGLGRDRYPRGPADADADAADRRLWRYAPPRPAGGPFASRNSPAVDDRGRIYAAIGPDLLALDDQGGTPRLRWRYPTGGLIPGSPSLLPDGSLRVHSHDGKLHAVDPEGRPLWPPTAVGAPLSSASPIGDARGRTWVCHRAGGLVRVDPGGQTSRRPFFPGPARFDCTGVLWDQTLVVGAEDHFLHAIDLGGERGAEAWDLADHRGDTGWYLNSAPAVASGPLFVVATSLGRLMGFGPRGEALRDLPVPGLMLGDPVVDDQDRAYVGLSHDAPGRRRPLGSLLCVDLRRGAILWRFEARAAVESTPVLGDDGAIYFGDNAGWIHAVDRDGQSLWNWDAGRPVRSRGAIAAPGRLLFADDAGELIALRCDARGLAPGWPKYMGDAAQSAAYPGGTARPSRGETPSRPRPAP